MPRAGILLFLCLAAPGVLAFDPPEENTPLPRRRVVGPSAATRPSSADLAAVARANNRFALDLFGELRRHDGNLFFSPLSIWAGLAMASAGARGETHLETSRALHLPPPATLHPALGQLLDRLPASREAQLGTACALWGQKGAPFHPEFLSLMRSHYRAGFETVDFAGAAEQARRHINGWVEKQTRQQIQELLRPGVLRPETALVLTSAIWFKGQWASEFPAKGTRDGDFHTGTGKTVRAPMMSQAGRFPYHETSTLQALELPYADKHTSLVVLLPRKVGLAGLEQELTADRLRSLLGDLKERPVHVTLPRFTLTVESQLRKPLGALGMGSAFTDAANFSGLTKERRVSLSAVVHKAFVEVEEHGTKAAAATAANFTLRSADSRAVFRADRPFVFLIRDARTGCVLFLGRLASPRHA
jgi:serpin B